MAEIDHSEAEWKALLTPEQFDVLRRAGTERPWSGKYVNEHADGTYCCAACGAERSTRRRSTSRTAAGRASTRPRPRTPWELIDDSSMGMVRTEVRCKRCGSHLGHVFPTARSRRAIGTA